MEIRRLASTDWEAFRDLRLAALGADPLAFGSTLERESAYPSDRWKGWTESGALGGESATFVAEAAPGHFVGIAGVFSDKGEYHIWGMWVSPEFRARGLGRELLDQILSWAQSTNPSRDICLDVNPVQTVALQLYESRGFRLTGKSSALGHHAPAVVQELRRVSPPPASPKV
jgi:ribosomal protein S18 acetylase RimI-like enzyme